MDLIRNIEQWISDMLPLNKIYYTILVVYLSIATNDIEIPKNSFLRKNYLAHIGVVFILSFLSLDIGNQKKSVFSSKIISAVIVTFIFYVITRPPQYDIFQ
jgi:hypothetical protein